MRDGLLLATTVGLPLLALWTLAGQVADWGLPVLGAPWATLVPVFAAAVFLMVSVRGLLRWLEGTAEAPAGDGANGAGDRPAGPRPCIDCPT